MGAQPSSHTQQNPVSQASRWLEGLKLAALTSAVGLLQFVRYQLAQDTRRRAGHSRPSPEDRHLLSPELRRAAINLIDYHLTPLLVDQWRLKLVAVMLSPETGPVVQSCSADTRKGLLGSLAAFQQDRRQARARTSEARDPVPMPQPPAVEPGNCPSSSPAAAASSSASAQSSIPAREHVMPSAPPLPTAHETPPSNSAASTSQAAAEPEVEECSICMEADIEVRVASCHHGMCIECARAVCSMRERAPQCPYCRCLITDMEPVPIVRAS